MKTLVVKRMKWTYHGTGFYGNKNFRILREGRKWWLSDIRNGLRACPSWWFYTAKEAMEVAPFILRKPCGHFHKEGTE